MQDRVRKRHEALKKEIHEHDYFYYGLDRPQISDRDYDRLFAELLELEKHNLELDLSDSPSQKVGGVVIDAFQKYPHRLPMLSLANTYSAEDLHDFDERVKKQLGSSRDTTMGEIEYACEPKLDGLALELIYENGFLTRALTRGDGLVGEDVTHSARTIKSVPLRISNAPPLLEVRGEVLMYKADFVEMNERLQEQGQSVFANPRNAAAGTLRQLDASVAAQRPLRFFAYALGAFEGVEFLSHKDLMEKLADWKFPIVASGLREVCVGIDKVIEFYHGLEKRRRSLDFEIDGMVCKINSFRLQSDLGFVARTPRWATAAKYAPEQVTTVVEDIALQVGRTGAITPVAKLRPASVGGVIVSNATLHNFVELKRKDVRIGDTVLIQRAGDVIPEVVNVVLDLRPKNSAEFAEPTLCPECQSQVVTLPEEIILRCPNVSCPAVLREGLKHFVSRRAMNIEKIGDRLVEELVTTNLVRSFPDFYRLQKSQLLGLDRMGEKSVQNILNSIEKSKSTTLARVIYASGIRFVGEQTAKALSEHFLTLEGFLAAKEQDLVSIPDIGPRVAECILHWLGDANNRKNLADLPDLGITFENVGRSLTGPLAGKSFLITGTLPRPRDEVKDLIESLGGKIMSSVSSKLNFLLVGEDPGSKLEKAQTLKVRVLSWDEFSQMIKK